MLFFVQTVAAALYDEGAVTVVYAILVNCSFMFERSSNIYGKLLSILWFDSTPLLLLPFES